MLGQLKHTINAGSRVVYEDWRSKYQYLDTWALDLYILLVVAITNIVSIKIPFQIMLRQILENPWKSSLGGTFICRRTKL
jgi:hypothetical protein